MRKVLGAGFLICLALMLPLWAASTVQPADLKALQGVLKSNRGRVVLVYFWATYSTSSAEAMPDLIALQSQYGSQGLQVVGVCSDDPATLNTKVLPFVSHYRVNFPNYIESGDHQAVVRFFSSTWVGQPGTSFIYNRNGHLVHELHGRQSLSDYQSALSALL